jgi:hypothetical protein
MLYLLQQQGEQVQNAIRTRHYQGSSQPNAFPMRKHINLRIATNGEMNLMDRATTISQRPSEHA